MSLCTDNYACSKLERLNITLDLYLRVFPDIAPEPIAHLQQAEQGLQKAGLIAPATYVNFLSLLQVIGTVLSFETNTQKEAVVSDSNDGFSMN